MLVLPTGIISLFAVLPILPLLFLFRVISSHSKERWRLDVASELNGMNKRGLARAPLKLQLNF